MDDKKRHPVMKLDGVVGSTPDMLRISPQWGISALPGPDQKSFGFLIGSTPDMLRISPPWGISALLGPDQKSFGFLVISGISLCVRL